MNLHKLLTEAFFIEANTTWITKFRLYSYINRMMIKIEIKRKSFSFWLSEYNGTKN